MLFYVEAVFLPLLSLEVCFMLDMARFKEFMNEAPGFNRHNGIRFTVVEEGYCECEVDLTQEGRNPQGVAHGSLLFAVWLGVAAFSLVFVLDVILLILPVNEEKRKYVPKDELQIEYAKKLEAEEMKN